MHYRAIIFDLDGVICHTDSFHYQAWKELADRLGIYFDEEINDLLRGVSRMESLEIILAQKKTAEAEKKPANYTALEKKAFAAEKNERYKKLLQNMTEADLSDEVRLTMERLRNRGLLLAVGSSSKNTRLILGRIGLGDYFDAVSDGTEITRSKPDPEVFVKAAQKLNVPCGDCLVVEDAAAGIQAAAAAGMDSAAIGDACRSGLATYRLKSFAGLLAIAG